MKSLRTTFCALIALLVIAAPALSWGADQLKVATFNIQQIIEKSKAGAEARKTLEAKKAELQPKFKGDQDALKAMASEIEKKGSAWSDEVKASKERDYQKRLREYQLKVEDAQFELKQLERKVLDPLFKELQVIISDIGKKEGISLIFEKSRSNGLLYAADSLDISDQVIKALDAKMPTINTGGGAVKK